MAQPVARDQINVTAGVVTRMVDGVAVLLDSVTGRYFRLDEIGSRAWSLLATTGSVERAYAALLAEYAVEPEQLRRDLDGLVAELHANGLLQGGHV